MIESRTTRIRWKVITLGDLRKLAETFHGICNQFISDYLQDAPPNKRYYRIEYKVETKDGSEFTSHDTDMFKEGSILAIKVIQDLQMHFYAEDGVDMKVNIMDSNLTSFNRSRITIQGSDSTWVNGTLRKLLDCVDSWQNQNTAGRKWSWLIGLGGTYLIGLAIFSLISAFSNKLESPFSSPVAALYALFFLGFSWPVADSVAGLWPELEIVPAQEHERQVQKKRGKFKWVITAIIIPSIIAVIVGYLTK
jgi:hypothetical protein